MRAMARAKKALLVVQKGTPFGFQASRPCAS
jgi:hypothetical protein